MSAFEALAAQLRVGSQLRAPDLPHTYIIDALMEIIDGARTVLGYRYSLTRADGSSERLLLELPDRHSMARLLWNLGYVSQETVRFEGSGSLLRWDDAVYTARDQEARWYRLSVSGKTGRMHSILYVSSRGSQLHLERFGDSNWSIHRRRDVSVATIRPVA